MVNIRLGAGRNSWGVSAGLVDLRREGVAARPVTVAARHQAVTLDLARTAIVVVDMQNDFCHADGWLASIGVDVAPARAPIEPLRRLLPWLRARGTAVVWLNWGNRPDRANLPPGVLHVYNPDGGGQWPRRPGPRGRQPDAAGRQLVRRDRRRAHARSRRYLASTSTG